MNTRQAAEWAGITYRTLDYWIAQGVITPAIEYGQGKAREFSQRDLVLLRLLVLLRGDGFRPDALQDTIALVNKGWKSDNPNDAGILASYDLMDSGIQDIPGGSLGIRGEYFFWFENVAIQFVGIKKNTFPQRIKGMFYSVKAIAQEVYQELNQPSLLPEP